MKKIFTILITLTLILQVDAQSEWRQERIKDGIAIFNRKMPNSKLKEYKGTVVVKAKMSKALAALSNPENHDKFIYKCKPGSVKVLKKANTNDFYTYMIIDTPWPASARDVITHYIVHKPDKDGAILIEVNGEPNMVPVDKNLVRVPEMKGYWLLKPLTDSTVEITHQAYSAPGGNVPEGMANTASVDAPYTMLSRLKTLLER